MSSTVPDAAVESPIVLAPQQDVLPFRFGTPEEFAALRAWLLEVGYTYEELYRRGRRRSELARGGGAEANEDAMPLDAVQALMTLFFDAYTLPWTVIRSAMGERGVALLEALGLLCPVFGEPRLAGGTVLLYPIAGVYIVSDHPLLLGRPAEGTRDDFVFAAMSTNTQEYLSFLPRTPCDAFAEMCGGTGVAAVVAGSFARTACTLDITERSTRFAEFNARLNGVDNVEALRGDLYAPVAGRTFDRIVAHPPYVPAVEQKLIFRDGGADGEQITRRVVSELHGYLRPGGRLYLVCLATDREEAPLERRLRQMLGEHEAEYDVLVVELATPRNPTEFYAQSAWRKDGEGFAEVERWHRQFKAMGVTRLVYSLIVLQRRAEERPTFTVRREKESTGSAQVEWILEWEERRVRGGVAEGLLDLPVGVTPWVTLQMRLEREGPRFVTTGATVVSPLPTRFDAECPAWVGAFLTACDGRTTVREHLAQLQARGMVPAELPPETFAEVLAQFVGAGVLLTPHLPPPPPYDPPVWERVTAE